jgi:hypothetical protein
MPSVEDKSTFEIGVRVGHDSVISTEYFYCRWEYNCTIASGSNWRHQWLWRQDCWNLIGVPV